MVTGSASISGSLHFDGVLPANLTVGSDSAADRKIVFGHTNVKAVMGLDHDSGDANATIFAINTGDNFESGNDLEIDSSGNVTLGNGGNLVLSTGGEIHGPTDAQLKLYGDTDVLVNIDRDGSGVDAKFKVQINTNTDRFTVDENGDTRAYGTMRIDGNSILGSTGGTPIQWDTSNNVTIGGDITIGGNDIRNSEGTTTMTLDSNEDVTFASHIMMGNNKEIQGISNVTLNYDQDNNGTGNLNIKSGGSIVMSINNAGVIETMPTIGGSSPVMTIGAGTNVKNGIVFDTDDSDFYIGTDINEHKSLIFGVGNTIGNNDAMTITSGSLIRFASGSNSGGIYQSPAVQVSNTYAGGFGYWIKIAETIESQISEHRTNTAMFHVAFASAAGAGAQYMSPESFMVYIHQAAGSADNIDGESYVVVDKLGSQFQSVGNTHHWEATTDCFMAQYNGRKAQLWMKANVNFPQVYVSILGGSNGADENYVGIGWQVCQGTSWSSSEPALGDWSKLYARWVSKDFDEVMVGGSLLCSGSASVAGDFVAASYDMTTTKNPNTGYFGNDLHVQGGVAQSLDSNPTLNLHHFGQFKSNQDLGEKMGEIAFRYATSNGQISGIKSAKIQLNVADSGEPDYHPASRMDFHVCKDVSGSGEEDKLTHVARISSAGLAVGYMQGESRNASVPMTVNAQSAGTAGGGAIRIWEDHGTSSPEYWGIGLSTTPSLHFKRNGSTTQGGYLTNTAAGEIDFTGQHRSMVADGESLDDYSDRVGLIVVSSGEYYNLPVSGSDGFETPDHKPNINESLPKVTLSTSRNQKSVYGVISDSEDFNGGESSGREYTTGCFVSCYDAPEDDQRLIINALGEGAIWICNINGNLENGDYITSCEIPGYGMKQDDDLMRNYTVAKITQDCDFDLNSTKYDVVEFEHEGQTLRKAFVGCTYHCG